MKFLKPKQRPLPETTFERFIHSQPVYNWFDRYDKSERASLTKPSSLAAIPATK